MVFVLFLSSRCFRRFPAHGIKYAVQSSTGLSKRIVSLILAHLQVPFVSNSETRVRVGGNADAVHTFQSDATTETRALRTSRGANGRFQRSQLKHKSAQRMFASLKWRAIFVCLRRYSSSIPAEAPCCACRALVLYCTVLHCVKLCCTKRCSFKLLDSQRHDTKTLTGTGELAGFPTAAKQSTT